MHPQLVRMMTEREKKAAALTKEREAMAQRNQLLSDEQESLSQLRQLVAEENANGKDPESIVAAQDGAPTETPLFGLDTSLYWCGYARAWRHAARRWSATRSSCPW